MPVPRDREMRPFEDEDDGAAVDEDDGPDVAAGSGSISPTMVPQKIGAALETGGVDGVSALEKPPVSLHVAPKKSKKGLRRKVTKGAKRTAHYVAKVSGVALMTAVLALAVFHWPPWIITDEHKRLQIMSAMFVVGLFSVAVEDVIGMNKSAMMLVLAATMWTFLGVGYRPLKSEDGAKRLHEELARGLEDVGSVILFLLPAMGVVESMDHFDAFALVNVVIRKVMDGHQGRLMPIICVFTFFLSSVIDNLTSTIVALKILRHLSHDEEHRHLCGGMVVLAANAGGAWSPVGDVTTTMLWIQGKITATATCKWLFLPSVTAGLMPLVGLWLFGGLRAPHTKTTTTGDGNHFSLPVSRRRGSTRASLEEEQDWEHEGGNDAKDKKRRTKDTETQYMLDTDTGVGREGVVTPKNVMVLAFGIMAILAVPALKISTALPPYLGMLLALGAMWLITDAIGLDPHGEGREVDVPVDLHDSPVASSAAETAAVHMGPPQNGVVAALHKLDLTGLLFFTGILLAVEALDSAGVLKMYAVALVKLCGGSPIMLCTLLGISSAVVDNVPLVQASIDMFDETPVDDRMWQLVALAAGTGGSILSIGSIAGVTLMSMDGVGFMWYLRRIGPWAMVGFFGGLAVYQAERFVFG